MFDNILQPIQKAYNYYKNPKYYINKGVGVYDRTYFSLFKNAKQHPKYTWCYTVESNGLGESNWGRNIDYGYDKKNVYKRIWTFKSLMKTARLFKGQYGKTMNSDFTLIEDTK